MDGVLLFDGDCGFCTRSAGWSRRIGCAVEPVPLQEWEHLAEHGITRAAADSELHLVYGDRVLRGHEAVAATLRTSRYVGVRVLGAVVGARALRPLAALTYRTVAAHRQQLPGGTPACEMTTP